MKYFLAIAIGATASALVSVWLSFGVAMTAGAQRHGLEAWPWLFAVAVVPCMLGSLALALAAPWTVRNRWRIYLAPAVAAFAATALAGSAGAIVVETISRGVARVNVSGYLTWCWVYAAALLPLTYPVAFLAQKLIHRHENKNNMLA